MFLTDPEEILEDQSITEVLRSHYCVVLNLIHEAFWELNFYRINESGAQ